jgi:hypothetical protein
MRYRPCLSSIALSAIVEPLLVVWRALPEADCESDRRILVMA